MSGATATLQTFLFSSFLDNPARYFQGYCFVGVDYIYGDEGASAFRDLRGLSVGPDEDGCYVSVSKRGDNYEFYVDFSGNKKLYYVWTPRYWAVSNSVSVLLEHLKTHGAEVTPNIAQLMAAGYGAKLSALNQASAYTTIANEIKLVPLRASLVIGPGGLGIRRNRDVTSDSYATALSKYCGLWISRLATLISSGVDVRCDLTGGVDSRTVLALLRAALNFSNAGRTQVGLRSGVVRGDTKDLEIASEIAGAIRLPLNERGKGRGRPLTVAASYESWRSLNIGVYHPVYFPKYGPDPMRVSLGGGGGENHRVFYTDGTFEALVDRCSRRMPTKLTAAQLRSEMVEGNEVIRTMSGSSTDPLILHYRHFRNRFHSGRAPQHTVAFSPLGSKFLECAAGTAGKDRRNGQINYDIMASVAPELLEYPFDDPAKGMSAERQRAVRRVSADYVRPGDVFIGSRVDEPGARRKGSAFELLESEFVEAASNPLVEELWGARKLGEVSEAVERSVRTGSFSHAIEGQPIAAVLASHLLLRR